MAEVETPERLVPVSPDLLDLLRCPACHGRLEAVPTPDGLGCRPCGLFYAVEDEIPDMIPEEARPWTPPRA